VIDIVALGSGKLNSIPTSVAVVVAFAQNGLFRGFAHLLQSQGWLRIISQHGRESHAHVDYHFLKEVDELDHFVEFSVHPHLRSLPS
jgi:hypothetical protein